MATRTRNEDFAPSLALPYALQVEITSACNLRCKMCPLTLEAMPSSRRPGHMREATWREVTAGEIGRVNLSGRGENTTHPSFVAMLGELVDLGITRAGRGVKERFALLIEGHRWLAGTTFELPQS